MTRQSYRSLSFLELLLFLFHLFFIFHVAAPTVLSFCLEPSVLLAGAFRRQAAKRRDGVVSQRLLSLSAAGTARDDDNDNDDSPNEKGQEEAPSWILPLFPLRKSIKLPGESLTLNLYEDRYLALATYVLQQQQEHEQDHDDDTQQQQPVCFFGALYTSDKPQIVTQGGRGPIVPMIQPGDLGVIFVVQDYEDAMIPTTGGLEERRRIRFEATAVARFCVDTILHDGHGGGRAVEQKDNAVEALPFILARVTLYADDNDNNTLLTNTNTATKNNNLPLSSEQIAWLAYRAKQLGIPKSVMQDEFTSFVQAFAVYRDGRVSAQRKAILTSRSTLERMDMLLAAGKGLKENNNNKGLFGTGR